MFTMYALILSFLGSALPKNTEAKPTTGTWAPFGIVFVGQKPEIAVRSTMGAMTRDLLVSWIPEPSAQSYWPGPTKVSALPWHFGSPETSEQTPAAVGPFLLPLRVSYQFWHWN